MSDRTEISLTAWLTREGWVLLEETNDVLRIKGDPARLIEEADQLLRELQANFELVFDSSKDGHAARIRTVYDPATGEAVIEVSSVD